MIRPFRLHSDSTVTVVTGTRFPRAVHYVPAPSWNELFCIPVEFEMVFEDPKAEAEGKLNDAEAALRAYAESEQRDPSVRNILIQNVNQAIANYLKLVEKQDE